MKIKIDLIISAGQTTQKFPNHCKLDKDEGVGSLSVTRFYFDEDERECKQFIYKGNGGNGNRFTSIGECKGICSGNIKIEKIFNLSTFPC